MVVVVVLSVVARHVNVCVLLLLNVVVTDVEVCVV